MLKGVVFSLFWLTLAGCVGAVPTSPPPSPLPSPTLARTVSPTAASATPPTSTPLPLKVSAKQTVNVRMGPGAQYKIIAKLTASATAPVLARSADGQWIQIAYPEPGHLGWVAVSVVSVSGPIDRLPVVKPGGVSASPTPRGAGK